VVRGGHRRVTKTLLSYPRMHARRKKLRRVVVAQIVEANHRHVFDATDWASALVGKAARLMWFTVPASADECLTGLSDAKHQPRFSRLPLEPAQVLCRKGGEADRSEALGLWRSGAQSTLLQIVGRVGTGFGLLEACDDRKRAPDCI
jgi:hypothetical protein